LTFITSSSGMLPGRPAQLNKASNLPERLPTAASIEASSRRSTRVKDASGSAQSL